MKKIETTLGNALFSVDINFQDSWPTNKWKDTTHFHIDSEIHIILEGSAVLEIDGKDVNISAGDICLLAPGSSHYPKSCSDTLEKANLCFRLIQNDHDAQKKKNFSEYVYYSNLFKSVSKYFIIKDDNLLTIVHKLLAEEFSDANEHIYQALLSVFFLTMAKRIKEQDLPHKEQNIHVASENEYSLRQEKIVEAFFQKRYNEEISIEDLAEELCLSVPQTHRIVKKVFDEGFKKTLIKQRIEHACMLIKQGDISLPEVAYLCGYTSYNGFLTAFKNYIGKSPREYKKSTH